MAGFLNIGEMGALALHVMAELAALREETPEGRMTAQDLAGKLEASVHTLQKVTRRLVAAGMLEGARGVNGGLRLVVPPERVSLLQVIEAVEGTLCSNGCMFAKRVCPPKKRCLFEGLTGIMEKQVRDYFTGTTLADLTEKGGTATDA